MDNPYQKLEKIGAGSFSTVYKGVHKETKQLVAIKILNLDTAEDEVADIRTEISLLTQLKLADVQNVTRYYASHLYGSKLWIIMDYCHGGSIRTLMEAGRFEEKYIAIIMREVLLALAYVHKCGIIHRDIKAANILMANDGRIQLCDFGVATQLAANHLKRNTFVGTPYWMAPEVITEGSMYNFKADIWSLGITVYEIATTRPPYADQEQMRALFLIPRSQPARLDGPGFSPQIKEFVGLCLQIAPDMRPTADELSKTRFVKGTSKMPTSTLRDLITRYARWQESGGVRQSIMISNRRGSAVSNEENEPDLDHDDVIAWDFDTSFSDIVMPLSTEEKFLSPTSVFDRPVDPSSPTDTIQTRPLRSTPQGQGNLGSMSGPPTPQPTSNSTTEHPLEQLFNDGTVRSATAPPTLRSRKDTITSRPLSPLPPLNGATTQPSSPDTENRPGTALGTGSYDLRLPDITPIAPIQIEIPATEETLRKDVPGVRSRSATVTRGTRSDSTGSSGFTSRIPRHNATEPMPPPHFPSVSARSESPKPQPPPLPTPLPSQITPSVSVAKPQPPPMSPPHSTSTMPPPTSPTKGHISSKSVPNNAPLSVVPLHAPSQEHMLTKARSTELKSSRAPHLTLNLPNQNQAAQVLPSELSPQMLSGVRPRSATTSEGLSATSVTPIITAIPPSPAYIQDLDFALPSLAPLNLSVLTEEASSGNGAGRLLTDELERILMGMAGILDVVGNGLTTLESETRPADGGTRTGNGDFDFGSMRDSNDGIRDRLDSLTSSFTMGGTMVRRS